MQVRGGAEPGLGTEVLDERTDQVVIEATERSEWDVDRGRRQIDRRIRA